VNTARGQVAGESRCIRAIGTLTAVIAQRFYNFSSINLGTPAVTGIQGAINVRRMQYAVGTGMKWVKGKSWPWFDFQRMNNPVPTSGAPTEWSQYGQGSASTGTITNEGSGTIVSGSLAIDPLPDLAYSLYCDCVCFPIALAADTDVEAISYLWTDCVPYLAGYLALMGSQTSTRIQQAQQLFALYEQFMQRARDFANPDMNNFAFEQSRDPVMVNRLGGSVQQAAGR